MDEERQNPEEQPQSEMSAEEQPETEPAASETAAPETAAPEVQAPAVQTPEAQAPIVETSAAPAAEGNGHEAATPPVEADDSKKWFIVHTYSGFEQKVAESLRSRAQAFGFADKIGQI